MKFIKHVSIAVLGFIAVANADSVRKIYTGELIGQPTLTIQNGAGVLSLPSSSDTLMGRSTTDTVINKSISGSSNTITNVDGDNVVIDPSGNLSSTNAQSAAVELQLDIDTRATSAALSSHLSDTSDAHDASAISSIPAGNLAASEVQEALDELQSDIDTRATSASLSSHLSDTVDAHAASAISSIASGNLSATEVQAALNELQTDIDTRATSAALTAHASATATHGVGTIVGTSEAQTLTTKGIDADNNTITNIDDGEIKSAANIARTKLASGTASHVLINDGSGVLSSEAQLAISRGGTGQSTATASFNALSPTTTKGDLVVNTGATNTRLPIGPDTYILTADSSNANGAVWAAPAVAASAPDSSYELTNLGLSVVESGASLIIALKDKSGSDPSALSPVKIGFRNSSATSGIYSQQSITSALSLTLAGGTTLNPQNQTLTVYIYIFNDGGVYTLGTSVQAFDDQLLLSSSTSTASNQVIYQSSALTSKPARLIGKFIATNTANDWATPSAVSVLTFNDTRDIIGVEAYQSSNQSLTSGTPTTLNVNTRQSDPHGAWNPSTFTFTAPRADWYTINTQVTYASNSTGQRGALPTISGGSLVESMSNALGGGERSYAVANKTVYLATGDTITLKGYQTSGGALNVLGGRDLTFVSIRSGR